MADGILQECERIINTFSNIPQPFYVEDLVIVQPSERKIYLKQIEPLEWTLRLLGYNLVDEYIFRKQYEEGNDLDDIRMGEIHIYDETRRAYVKWQEEGSDGVRVWKEDKGMEAKPWRTFAVCKRLQQQMGLWT